MIKVVIHSYTRAHELLWKNGYWRYLLAPIALSFLLVFLLIILSGGSATLIGIVAFDYLSTKFSLPDWGRPLLIFFLFSGFLGPCYVLFRGLVLMCYAPFLDSLAEKVELLENGEAKNVEKNLFQSIKRPLGITFLSLAFSSIATFSAFALGFIPVVGILFSTVILIPLQFFLSAIAYIDPYLDRCDYRPRQAFRLMAKHFPSVVLFGAIGFVLTVIPIFGWFLGPTYSVVSGLILASKLDRAL